MHLTKLVSIAALTACANAALTTLDELLEATARANVSPDDCVAIDENDNVWVCHKDGDADQLMKVAALDINPYPLAPGHVQFKLTYKLYEDVPKGSKLELTSFADDDQPFYDGELDLCEWVAYGRVQCPIPKTVGFEDMKQTLEVPDDANPGNFSFFGRAMTPDNREIVQFAGIVELVNPSSAVHGDDL